MAVSSNLSEDGKQLTIIVGSKFDISTYQEFSTSYKDHLASVSVEKTIVDMSTVAYIDSSALGMLLLLRERAGATDACIQITNCSPEVKEILQVANFGQLFDLS